MPIPVLEQNYPTAKYLKTHGTVLVSKSIATDVKISVYQNGYALYERNIPVITSGFHFYYGGGVNLGGWEKHGDTKFTAGINGIVGLEYKIASIPLAFSVDYKPCLNFAGHTGFHAADFGLGIKVAF